MTFFPAIMKKIMVLAIIFFHIELTIANEIVVNPTMDLQQIIYSSTPNTRIFLEPGQYNINLIIERPISIIGSTIGKTEIIGDNTQHVIWVQSPDVTIENLYISGSGKQLSGMHSGVFLDKNAHNAHIHHNQIMDNLFGVYIWGPDNALVEHNFIQNDDTPRLASRGNGVSLWRSPGSIVRHNHIIGGRDGIYTNASINNIFEHNKFNHLRFAVHYMYTEDSEVRNNHAEEVDSAYVLMFSNRIKVINNTANNAKEHGIMLNSVNHSQVFDNIIDNVNKATFIYNANFNNIHHNVFKNSQIGIHFTAGSEQNAITDNAFINNRTQVMYVSTREVQWQHNGRGNYWSDHSSFDLNGDGIADTSYRPNNLMDQILWRAPSAKLLINSPAAQLLKYAQQQFPSLLPGGVTDPYPLMNKP